MRDYPLTDQEAMTLRRAVLHRIQLHCVQHFTREFVANTSLAFQEVAMADAFQAHLRGFITGVGEERVRVDERWPRTWWDAVKLRWFPTFIRWRLMRPVSWNSVHMDRPVYAAVCPHHFPLVDGHHAEVHVQWLVEQEGR